jgi:membrane peptidoglycan carboxypeptidase
MVDAAHIVKSRRIRRLRDQHRPGLMLGLVFALFFSLIAVGLAAASASLITHLSHDLPAVSVLPLLLDSPNGKLLQPTHIYDRTRQTIIATLENPGAAAKQYLFVSPNGEPGLNQASTYLVNALILEMEPGFWHSPGYSLGGAVEGTHPTLAQYLVSNLVLENEAPSLRRNLRERILAAQLTADYGREKVLEWYLNSARFGEMIYGADAAAQVYFGKSAANLTLAEAAMLTAFAENPYINPSAGTQTLKQQQELIIQKLLVKGWITGSEAQSALKEEVNFIEPAEMQAHAPAFTQLVLTQLSTVIPIERLYRGGYEITSSLDADLQSQAACVVNAQIARLHGAPVDLTLPDGSPCVAASLLPDLIGSANAQDLAGEVVVVDPISGQVLALVEGGEIGTLPDGPTRHTAGSILSPLLYLTAFARGMSPATLLWDLPTQTGAAGLARTVEVNANLRNFHGPVSLRQAFVNNYGGAATEVIQQVGIDNVWMTENLFGFDSIVSSQENQAELDQFLSQSISALQGIKVYAALANQGTMSGIAFNGEAVTSQANLEPVSVLSVNDAMGQMVVDWTRPKNIALVNPQLAYLVSNMLSDGSARLADTDYIDIGRPAAFNASVTDGGEGAWAMGYIPSLVVGVWVGAPDDADGKLIEEVPGDIWHAVMEYASRNIKVDDFSVPGGITTIKVCQPSGMLPTPLCPATAAEVFLEGNEPSEIDSLYKKYMIDRETGLLATSFTPAAQVEEKVFMDLPASAQAWARQAGVEIPPTEYDTLPANPAFNNSVNLSSVNMFDHVSGTVVLTGTAAGPDFSYFRIQVGQGLNPQAWFQVGENSATLVYTGTLGTWDTTGLNGLYIIQLMVIRQDRRIDQSMIQVTVDNSAPQVEITSPGEGEKISVQAGEKILLSASVQDNQGLESVEFYLDDILIGTISEFPYAILWDAQAGEHILNVEVYDQAGNSESEKISFSVSK